MEPLLIGKTGDDEFFIDPQELVTGRTCIIAQSGAGKSYGIAVLCEQLCTHEIGFCLIDTEGEYFSLKDRFRVLWVGTDERCDEDIETVNLRELMNQAVRNGTPVLYDVSETDMQERVSKLAGVIYDIASELRIPYLLIVEEADKFIPQGKESIKKIEEISRRGRKRGLGLLVATQRPALVTKHVLSQCNNQIIGKLSIENDLRAVDLFFGSRKEVEELVSLSPGEFYIMGRIVREKTRIRFNRRVTTHRGLTPQLAHRPKASPPPAPEPQEGEDAPVAEEEVPEEPEGPLTLEVRNAVRPLISRERALEIAEGLRKRRILGLGPDEKIASVQLFSWPFLQVEMRYIGGMVRKRTRSTSFLIDGLHGNCARFKGGLRLRPCINELLDLGEDAVRVLSRMNTVGATETELESATRLSPAAVKRALRDLEEKRKITRSGKAGEAVIYVPLLMHRVPKLAGLSGKLEAELSPVKGKVRNSEIEPEKIRTILKGIENTAEVTSCAVRYYPLFEVTMVSDRGTFEHYIDAVTGRSVSIPE